MHTQEWSNSVSAETLVFKANCQLPTRVAVFQLFVFEEVNTNKEHIALVLGEIDTEEFTLLRIHSECMTGDTLFSLRCDCGAQLEKSMRLIADKGAGVLLYMRQEGRGIGLINKIRAYQLQDQGQDTVEANLQLGFADDQRNYDVCKPMLHYFGINKITLLSNNLRKVIALQNLGLEVRRTELLTKNNIYNENYLRTKANRLGHLLQYREAVSDTSL